MASYRRPKVPAFANALSAEIVQTHSNDYQNLTQLKPGGVLIVGAGNWEPSLQWSRSAPVIEHGYRGGILVMCLFDPRDLLGATCSRPSCFGLFSTAC